ncbi:glycine zipper domain-containing protein [Bdellovibrio sp. HCB2-146]|uniref:glycine zipper domain-containing protein n=1 Tax=Bdellovibrio sp. HCB2-146 TaxID=3394362 RepID=UPI0039BC4E86
MDRDQLIAEIKKQLKEELQQHAQALKDQIPPEQKEQLQDLQAQFTKAVKENPWTSVGVAAVVGFMLARLLYRRKD